MIERVEQSTTFRVAPLTEKALDEMPPEVAEATDSLLQLAVKSHGLKPVSAAGYTEIEGLQDRADAWLEANLPACKREVCTMCPELSGAATSAAGDCKLTLSCDEMQGPDSDIVAEYEKGCLAHHSRAIEAFAALAVRDASDANDLGRTISVGKAMQTLAEQKLGEVI